jgi:hypothetical protein
VSAGLVGRGSVRLPWCGIGSGPGRHEPAREARLTLLRLSTTASTLDDNDSEYIYVSQGSLSRAVAVKPAAMAVRASLAP